MYLKFSGPYRYSLYSKKPISAIMSRNYMKVDAKHLNPLPELPGNISIEQQLQKNIESNEELTILYFDIDNFKPYNDVYGFENGDKVIVKLADVLRKQATETEFVAY